MAAAGGWKPDIVTNVFAYLDLPTQARFALASKTWVTAKILAVQVAAMKKLASHVVAQPDSAAPFALLATLPRARAFLLSAKAMWSVVSTPLLQLHDRMLECPGLLGDSIAEVHFLGCGERRCILSERWWRQRLGRFDRAASQRHLRGILRERNLSENIPAAITALNPWDPDVSQAMAILEGGTWSFHLFRWLFDDVVDELIEAKAVLEFKVHGVYGIVYFRDLYFYS